MPTQQTQPQVNFPAATDAQWAAAWQIVHRAAVRAGYDHAAADDMAQTAMLNVRGQVYRRTSPRTPEIAARWEVKARRRYGWARLLPPSDRPRGRNPDESARMAEWQTMATYRQRAGNLTPAQMAEQAEQWGGIQRAAAIRAARADGLIDAVLAAQGIGPTAAVHEHGHTPSLYQGEPRQRQPLQGCPGLHTACDPVPGSHARRAEECAAHAAEVAGR